MLHAGLAGISMLHEVTCHCALVQLQQLPVQRPLPVQDLTFGITPSLVQLAG